MVQILFKENLKPTAEPALVDPGLTAQLECSLDDVALGKQEMIGAIEPVALAKVVVSLPGNISPRGLPRLRAKLCSPALDPGHPRHYG